MTPLDAMVAARLAEVAALKAERDEAVRQLEEARALLESYRVDLSAATLGPASPADLVAVHRADCAAIDTRPTPPETPRAKRIEDALTSLGAKKECCFHLPVNSHTEVCPEGQRLFAAFGMRVNWP